MEKILDFNYLEEIEIEIITSTIINDDNTNSILLNNDLVLEHWLFIRSILLDFLQGSKNGSYRIQSQPQDHGKKVFIHFDIFIELLEIAYKFVKFSLSSLWFIIMYYIYFHFQTSVSYIYCFAKEGEF